MLNGRQSPTHHPLPNNKTTSKNDKKLGMWCPLKQHTPSRRHKKFHCDEGRRQLTIEEDVQEKDAMRAKLSSFYFNLKNNINSCDKQRRRKKCIYKRNKHKEKYE